MGRATSRRGTAAVLVWCLLVGTGQASALTFRVLPGGGSVVGSRGERVAAIAAGTPGRCNVSVQPGQEYDWQIMRPPFDPMPLHVWSDGSTWRYRTPQRSGLLDRGTVLALSRTLELNVEPDGFKTWQDAVDQGAPGLSSIDVAGVIRAVHPLQQEGRTITLPRGWSPGLVFVTRSGFATLQVQIPPGALDSGLGRYPEQPLHLQAKYGPFSYPAFNVTFLVVLLGLALVWLYAVQPRLARRRRDVEARLRVADEVLKQRLQKPPAKGDVKVVTGSRGQGYLLLRKLGAGGMGTVHEAIVVGGTESVAVKVLNQAPPEGSVARQRVAREIRLCETLQHPSIVKVLDSGVLPDDTPFMVMELVSGQTLKRLLELQGGPLPVPRVLAWLRDVLAGLRTAHQAGIVHRDLKPENLIETESKRVKIMDFGVAHEAAPGLTSTRDVLGTPAYMSPEQIEGAPSTPASDVYSLGVVAYELLCGERPFQADDGGWAVMALALNRDARPLCEANPAISPRLSSLVMRMMARKAEQRYQSCDEVLAALQACEQEGVG